MGVGVDRSRSAVRAIDTAADSSTRAATPQASPSDFRDSGRRWAISSAG